MHTPQDRNAMARLATDVLARLRAKAPRVHCVTNAVAQNFTANVLLAAGAVPSMTIAPEEIGAFVAGANALLVNLGTFDNERREAIGIAVGAAQQAKIPWVLDPVFVDRVPPRAAFARGLLARRPVVVRLNRAEFVALSGGDGGQNAVADFARANNTVVALSGATDLVADGTRFAQIRNGHELMARVTAMGCAGSAIAAACLAVEPDAWQAAAAALTIFGVAGEVAAENAAGPGSFAVAFIDTIYRLDAAILTTRAKVT